MRRKQPHRSDPLTRGQRSALMSRIGGRNTGPEAKLSAVLRSMRYRFATHDRSLPGTPDFVLMRHNVAIFVNGCFWHRHRCRKGRSMPSTRTAFWIKKLEGNKTRDAANRRKLRRLGWDVLTIWECQTRDTHKLKERLVRFLSD